MFTLQQCGGDTLGRSPGPCPADVVGADRIAHRAVVQIAHPASMGALGTLGSGLLWTVRLALLAVAAYWAYDIRMLAIREYGRLIHEFDPWFNYRAAEYMFEVRRACRDVNG